MIPGGKGGGKDFEFDNSCLRHQTPEVIFTDYKARVKLMKNFLIGIGVVVGIVALAVLYYMVW